MSRGLVPIAGGAIALTSVMMAERQPKPPDWRTIEFLRDILGKQRATIQASQTYLKLVVKMLEAPDRATRVNCYREMRFMRLGDFKILRPAWDRIVRKQLGWFTRTRLGVFG